MQFTKANVIKEMASALDVGREDLEEISRRRSPRMVGWTHFLA